MAWVAVVVLTPIFEETLYRGLLLEACEEAFGPLAAVLLTSTAFALSHAWVLTPPRLLEPFCGGLCIGLLAWRTRSLPACIGLHAGWNLAAVT